MSGQRIRGAILAPLRLLMTTPILAERNQIVGVASVIDGDTIEIHGQRIRLFGIDAPESASCVCDRPGSRGVAASRRSFALADRIGHHVVSCQPRDLDRYGRVVAVCFNGPKT